MSIYCEFVLPFKDGYDGGRAVTAILSGKPVTLSYPGVIDSGFNFISGFLHRLLSQFDIGFLSELLLVLLKEITSNCSKANAKRIFFTERSLEITDTGAYTSAMTLFADEVLGKWEDFQRKNSRNQYYINLTIQLEERGLAFIIENNCEILPQEWERIKTRLSSFQKYKDIEKAFAEIRDSSEGAGLGIVMTLLLLQNTGIPVQNYNINSSSGVTSTSIVVPTRLAPAEIHQKLKDEISGEIEEVPSFPKNISTLLQLCESDRVSLQLVSDRIKQDPALTAQVLKLVNSAGYIQRNRNPSIHDAVKIIGLKEIRNLLMVQGARASLDSRYRYREMEQIWEESNKVSFFARTLAKGKPKAVGEGATLAGLLYELGKIVLLSLNPELIKRIHELMGSGRIRNSSVIEEISVGISHPEIGALMAKKWNFPDSLVMAIRFQQKPLQAPIEYDEIIQCVYMATKIHEADINRGDYYAVEPDILQKFGINNEKDFADKVSQMVANYKAFGGGGV